MPSREEITYFGAGPAGLITEVLQQAAEALVNYNDTGLGLAEHSHRSELATSIINNAKSDLKSFLDIPDSPSKNLGMTGMTVVVIKKDLLPPVCPQPSATLLRYLSLAIPPIILQYEKIAKNNSFVYVAGSVLKRLLSTYPNKVDGQQATSEEKAKLVSDALDAHPEVYKVVRDKSCRSNMNICFRITKGGDTDGSEKNFLKEATALGLTGLKGHRSVGGIRASVYNAVPLQGPGKLAQFINRFAKN